VESWPQNPVDLFIEYLQGRPADLVVADFGCGEARLAASLHSHLKKIHSFDLVAANSFITACDISNVPLKDSTVDIAIFCLSLMGTNFLDFLREAHRVLKPKGTLKIAEVVSRFPSINAFVDTLVDIGFRLTSKDTSNKMFILFEFEKQGPTPHTKSLTAPADEATPVSSSTVYTPGMGPRPPKALGKPPANKPAQQPPHKHQKQDKQATPLLTPCVYKRR